MSVTVQAPAKINLTLDVIDRRADGYHILESVMQTVDICDEISLEISDEEGIFLTCSNPDLPTDARNTAYRAAEVFYQQIGRRPRVRIAIEKHIPMEAGMGGESADAAGVLHGLNRLERAGFSVETLCELGSCVGADVPFCVWQGTALSEGVGSILTSVSDMPDAYIVLGKGEKGVSTAEAYAAIDAAGSRGRYAASPAIEALCEGDLVKLAASLGNVFDEVLALPDVQGIKALMRDNGALGYSMTGSGSAVFGLFDDRHAALSCQKRLDENGFATWICHPYRPKSE